MKVFNSIEEIEKYYDEKTNTYVFIEDSKYFDIKFNFNFNKQSNIDAWNINACNIDARNINAGDINAGNINARNINAWNIKAWNINARNISFYSLCVAYITLMCNSIEGKRENSKYLCLNSEPVIKGENK